MIRGCPQHEAPLELKIGDLQQFPEKMRSFSRATHDGLVLDDVRDLDFVVNHQDALQGKYDSLVEFGTTPGGQCAFWRDLFATPVVVTVDFSTKHLEYLDKHDWLGDPGNRVLVTYPPPPTAQDTGAAVAVAGG